MLRRKLFGVAAACALGAVSSVAALAQEDEQTPPPGEGVAQVAVIEQDAQDAMALFERSRASADAMPADVAEHFDAEADFGMNPDLSRRAIANVTHSVYAIPADDHVCAALTVGEGAVMTCPLTAAIADGRAGPATVSLDGDIAIYGLLPDGIDSVAVDTGLSDTTIVETSDNAYYTVIPAGTALRRLRYTGPSGAVEFPLRDPSLAFEE